jgi:hypothetical protein
MVQDRIDDLISQVGCRVPMPGDTSDIDNLCWLLYRTTWRFSVQIFRDASILSFADLCLAQQSGHN